jgi:hypothetical protein
MSVEKKKGRGQPRLDGRRKGIRIILHITRDLLGAINAKTKLAQIKDPKTKRADVIRNALFGHFFPEGKRRLLDQKMESPRK